MGGDFEKQLSKTERPQASSPSGVEMPLIQEGSVRIHSSQGEVHFHDDKAKIKVAVPAATFWKEWKDFQATKIARKGEQITFFDASRQTAAVIESHSRFSGGKLAIAVTVDLVQVEQSDNVKKLADFASQK